MTAFFGLGIGGRAEAAASYSLDAGIYQDPTRLAVGRLNLAAVGLAAYAPGDGRGALALASANEQMTSFGKAGGLAAASMTLSRYATEVAGSLGRRAGAAETAKESANAVKAEADNRRSSYEGVNTDEELIKLTTYQQAFNASARLIQASNDLYDTLLSMVD
jgi:flagellar hook-associated protein 1 FlgK